TALLNQACFPVHKAGVLLQAIQDSLEQHPVSLLGFRWRFGATIFSILERDGFPSLLGFLKPRLSKAQNPPSPTTPTPPGDSGPPPYLELLETFSTHRFCRRPGIIDPLEPAGLSPGRRYRPSAGDGGPSIPRNGPGIP